MSSGEGTVYMVRVYTFGDVPKDAQVRVEVEQDDGAWWKPKSGDDRCRFEKEQPLFRYGPMLCPTQLTRLGKVRVRLFKGAPGWGIDKVEVQEIKSDRKKCFLYGGRITQEPIEIQRLDVPEDEDVPAEDPTRPMTPVNIKVGSLYMVHVYTADDVPDDVVLAVEVQGQRLPSTPTTRWWSPTMPTSRFRFEHRQPRFRYGPLSCGESVDGAESIRVWLLKGTAGWVLEKVELRSLASSEVSEYVHSGAIGTVNHPLLIHKSGGTLGEARK